MHYSLILRNMCNKTFSVKLKFIITFLLFSAVTHTMLAQSRPQKNWIFGSGEVITFGDDADHTPEEGDDLTGQGARAVANDPATGDLLFYTDGENVYDACGNTIATGLGGNANGIQPVVISPVPNLNPVDGTLEYYIIVNVGGNIEYREISIVTNVTPPPVAPDCQFEYTISGTNQATGISGIGDAMAVIPNDDNSGYWLITQTPGTDEYRITRITESNIGPTQPYNVNLGTNINAVSFSHNPVNNQIAVSSDNGAAVQILNINPATGALSFAQEIGGLGAGQSAFDTEWSEDGTKLYITTGTGGQLFQYDFTTSALNTISTPGVTGSFGLKRGPDGNIYQLYEDASGDVLLAQISAADSAALLLTYSPSQLNGMAFDPSTQYFPEFSPLGQQSYNVGFNFSGNCQDQPTQFYPFFSDGAPMPDSLVWTIEGGNFTEYSPSHTFQNPSGGPVTVTAYWPGTSSTFTVPVSIQPFDIQIQIPSDTTICPGTTATLNAEPQSGQQGGGGGGGGVGGTYDYLWSTGETTAEIEVGEAGVYWVVVRDQNSGCAAYAESNVKEYQVENQTYNVWYFGNGGGLDFNTLYDPDGTTGGAVTGLGDGILDAPEAMASVSDGNGDILFYTDGESMVFVTKDPATGNSIHQNIPVGTELGGDQDASQVIMVQVPETDGMYYVFTSTAVENGGFEIRYSVVDLKAGGVVSANNLLFTNATESMAIYGGQGSNAVLVIHEYGNNNFRSYPISSQGIGRPVVSSEGSTAELNIPADARGYMKFGGISDDSTSTVIAVPFGDKIEVYDFDLQTLEITGPRTTINNVNGFPYGMEFQGDTLIFTTNFGIYYADASGVPPNVNAQTGTTGSNFGALQAGPDGQIYVAVEGASSIGTVSVSQGGISYQPNAVDLQGATSGLGLPNEIKQGGNSFEEPTITVDNACAGNETSFTATPTDAVIDQFQWTIFMLDDNGQQTGTVSSVPADSLTQDAFTHIFDETGNFRAIVNITNPCGLDTTLIQDFTVVAGIDLDALQPVVNLCQGGAELSAVSTPTNNLTFEWVQLNAQGGGNLPPQNTIVVNDAGNYQITVTDSVAGCVVDSTSLVVDARPPVNLPDDFTICQDETRTLDVTIASPAPAPDGYQWRINGAAAGNTSTLDVDTSVPGLFTYTVRVTDDSPEGCFVDDTVAITVQEIPAFNLAQSPTSGCGVDDGEIDLTLTSDPNASYQFSWTDNAGNPVGTTEDLSTLTAGVYNVTVTNEGGCSAQGSIEIVDGGADFDFNNITVTNSGCEDNSGSITVELDNTTVFPIDFTLSGNEQRSGFSVPTNNFTITGLSAGTYNLEVVGDGGSGCTQSETGIVIDPAADSVEFTFTEVSPQSICGVADVDITVNYNLSDNWLFLWEGPNGNVLVNNQEIPSINVTQSGEYRVTVSDVDDPNLCPSTQTFEVNIFENPVIEIQQTTNQSCETGEELVTVEFSEEAPEGDYVYSWTVDGTFVGNGPTITATQSGDYQVVVRNIQTGCFANREEPVLVNELIEVDILSGVPCDGEALAMFASVSIPREEAEFSWFGPNGNALAPSNSPIGDSLILQTDAVEGVYVVRVSRGECEVEEDANFQRFESPVSMLAEGPLSICSEDFDPEISQVVLDAGFAPQILWTIPDGNFNNTQTVTADQGGIYTVVLTNAFGCSVTDSVQVLDDCTPQVFAPNAFVPSGTNSEFFVYTQYVADDDFEVLIYNRWGELIFRADNPDFRWDGTNQGKPVPSGTYPFIIYFKGSTTDSSDQVYEERGGVTVIR